MLIISSNFQVLNKIICFNKMTKINDENEDVTNSTIHLESQQQQQNQLINDSFLMCRICHCEEKSSSNLLISPCKCNGSLNFVHQACLQKWLQITGNLNYFVFKSFKN